jgi:hypothetical protein
MAVGTETPVPTRAVGTILVWPSTQVSRQPSAQPLSSDGKVKALDLNTIFSLQPYAGIAIFHFTTLILENYN